MIILIPAYEPDERLVALVESIKATAAGQRVLIVDDGSGADYRAVFAAAAAAGAEVVGHELNRGKGFALKRGFAHIHERFPTESVVCADCDGQHAIADIYRVADEVALAPGAVVLGSRQFEGDVPSRSRFGNTLTRRVFRLATGQAVHDTQTGLRGYGPELLPWLATIAGDRFEYELEILLAAQRAGVEVREVPIATIYFDGNESSHFRTVRDSIRVYVPFVKFGMSSLGAFALDTSLLLAMMGATDNLALSVVTARVTSATFNYLANRRLVFAGTRTAHRRSAARYARLAAALMAANYLLLHLLHQRLGLGLLGSKLLTEAVLFVLSFVVQQRHVFASAPAGRPSGTERSLAAAKKPELVA